MLAACLIVSFGEGWDGPRLEREDPLAIDVVAVGEGHEEPPSPVQVHRRPVRVALHRPADGPDDLRLGDDSLLAAADRFEAGDGGLDLLGGLAVEGVRVVAERLGCRPDADEPLTADLVEWADVILVMEAGHRPRMARVLGRHLRGKRMICLAIPDDFESMEPALVELLWKRVPRAIPALTEAKPA